MCSLFLVSDIRGSKPRKFISEWCKFYLALSTVFKEWVYKISAESGKQF